MESQTPISFRTSSHAPTASILLAALSICSLLAPAQAVSREKPWFKYENRYFEVQSNASRRKTLALLTELENFRAAVLQVTNISVPDDAPKTLVLIMKSNKEFSKYTRDKSVAGYAVAVNDRTMLVMPATRDSGMNEIVIRHEYVHALLRYKEIEYPVWFEEGFAELASSISFRKKDTIFTVGEHTGRWPSVRSGLVDWNRLVSEEFDMHEISSGLTQSNAYWQSWLLVHYLTLGNNFQNADNLQGYFDLTQSGKSSLEAFELAFGVTPTEWAEKYMSEYFSNMLYVAYDFRPGVQDHDFERREITAEQIAPTLTYLSAHANVFKKPKSLKKSLQSVSGLWDNIQIDGFCQEPEVLTLSPDQSSLTFESGVHLDAADEGSHSTTFEAAGDDEFLLPRDDELGIPLKVLIRAENTICLTHVDAPEARCISVLKKCPPP